MIATSLLPLNLQWAVTYDNSAMSMSVVHSGWIAEVMHYGKINKGNDVGGRGRVRWGAPQGLSPQRGGGAGGLEMAGVDETGVAGRMIVLWMR